VSLVKSLNRIGSTFEWLASIKYCQPFNFLGFSNDNQGGFGRGGFKSRGGGGFNGTYFKFKPCCIILYK